MKRIIALLCAVLALSAGSLKATETESEAADVVRTQQFNYKDFQNLSVSSSFKVNLVQDSKWFVEVEYSDFLEEYLDVNVNGGTLKVGLKPLPRSVQNSRRYKNGPVLKATVHMPRLVKLSMSGASKLWQEGQFKLSGDEDFRMDISGASVAENLHVDARKARLSISGAAKCPGFEGAFYQLNLNVSGAGKSDVNASADDWDVVLSGSARVELRGKACQTLDIESSGASKAEVSIPSEKLHYEGSGASDLSALDAPTREARVELSGASTCRIAVKESLGVEASGASVCRYKAIDGAALKTRFEIARGSKLVSL
jgi:hypothetical protein